MRAPLQAYMRVGIVHFAAYPSAMAGENVLDSLQEIVNDPYFDAVEVTTVRNPQERRQVADLLAQSGMVVGYGAQPVQLSQKLDLGAADPAERERTLTTLRRCVDEAYEIGARQFVLLSGPEVSGPGRQGAIDRTIESLVELSRYSRSQGSLPICLESFDFDIDKKRLVGPNRLAAEISAQVRRQAPDFGILVDLSHLPLQHETIRDGLAAVGQHLTHAHIGNCVLRDRSHPLYGDWHPRFGHPDGENGVPELTQFLQTLIQLGYLKPGAPRGVAFEVRPGPGEDSRTMIANAKRALQQAWAAVGE